MPRFVVRWIATGLAIVLTGYLLPGVRWEGAFAVIMAALVLGLLNAVVRPVLIILTLPISFFTLGIFLLFINAFTLWLAVQIVPGFSITGVSYIWAALLITLISWILNWFMKADERRPRRY